MLNVAPYSPAAKAGFQLLDIIYAVDGKRVKSIEDYKKLIQPKQAGEKLKLLGYRKNTNRRIRKKWIRASVSVTLTSKAKWIDSSLASDYDNVVNSTFIKHKDSPHNVNRTEVYFYIAKPDDGKPFLRAKIQYFEDDWLFINKITFSTKDKNLKFTLNGVSQEINTQKAGWVNEFIDVPVSEKLEKLLPTLVDDPDATVRLGGRTRIMDLDFDSEQQLRLQVLLEKFAEMKTDKK